MTAGIINWLLIEIFISFVKVKKHRHAWGSSSNYNNNVAGVMQDELKVKISSGEAAKFMWVSPDRHRPAPPGKTWREFDYHCRMTTERFSTKGELMTNLLPRVEISCDVTSKPEPNPFWRALSKNYSTSSGHISRNMQMLKNDCHSHCGPKIPKQTEFGPTNGPGATVAPQVWAD